MSLTFRTAGDWGAGADGPLTPTQRDENAFELMSRIVAAETSTAAAVTVASFAAEAGAFTATLTDATVLGPFPLPIAPFRWRGDWEAATEYQARDLVVHPLGLFEVLREHTAPAAFEAGHRLANGRPAYGALMALPPAGALGAVRAEPAAAYTLALADAFTMLDIAEADAVTVPPASEVAFEAGAEIGLRQSGSAPVDILAGAGVTLNPVEGRVAALDCQGAVARLKKVGADAWDIWGDLASAEIPTETATEAATE